MPQGHKMCWMEICQAKVVCDLFDKYLLTRVNFRIALFSGEKCTHISHDSFYVKCNTNYV